LGYEGEVDVVDVPVEIVVDVEEALALLDRTEAFGFRGIALDVESIHAHRNELLNAEDQAQNVDFGRTDGRDDAGNDGRRIPPQQSSATVEATNEATVGAHRLMLFHSVPSGYANYLYGSA
jgi:hypothetical protein